ncbi:hypothetical protein CkaCkLH20_05038 [Colletotrichum karsti]|uniref:Uncharacterized protein n=1 Tax=Colletotrichum karsti TaxID=1095194 RepID=A0A9P6I6M3_9PEZI|nr:uncharacterized protein CkaCkLH20_05038 [Colletotrichum karsti]KAF9877338.1 hypothetical protein CkaCkLH20_05038 [Colletotrichum karsti]
MTVVPSSSLSELSAVSSPDSFRTAFQSPEGTDAMDAQVDPPPLAYSMASQLPRELKAHCQIYLEEHLYNGALGLLNSLLTSGYSRKDVTKTNAQVPPPTHLALLNTLIIHPSSTTRAAGADRLEVGSQALDYLRNLLAIAGPINAGFQNAFQFYGGAGRGRNRYVEEDDDEIDGDQISNKMAVEDSIWHRAPDFWAVVGWAFNCSSAHPHRWRFWKTWLEFMLEVLDADYEERKRMDEAAQTPDRKKAAVENRREAMIVTYIKQRAQYNRQGLKTILQAVLADGYSKSLAAFPEIFNKETKGLPSEDTKRRRMITLDIDNDQFGDYFDDDLVESEPESQPGTPNTPATPRTPSRKAGNPVTSDVAESIPLRLRLFNLLAKVSMEIPKDFFQKHDDYVKELCTLLRQTTPLPFFQQFISDMGTHLDDAFRIDILLHELDCLLPRSYMEPGNVASSENGMKVTAEVLELCYLPHPADTSAIQENVRLALILENLLYKIPPDEIRNSRDKLRAAAQVGVEARKWKTRNSGQKVRKSKKQKELCDRDRYATETLDLVGERILLYIEIMGGTDEEGLDETDSDEEMTD